MKYIFSTSNLKLLLLLLAMYSYTLHAQTPSFEWVQQMGGTGADAGRQVLLDGAGNVYLSGEFSGTVDFDPGPGVQNLTALSGSNTFVAKYTPAGALVWATRVGAAQGSTSMTMDNSGNLYVVPTGGYIAKLSNTGSITWSIPVNFSYAYDIANDNAGNIYLTGIFTGTVDFDPGPGLSNLTATATYNTFVLKIDGNGALVWAKAILSNNDLQGKGIIVGSDARLYICGYFGGTGDFDPGLGVANLTAGTSPAMFITKWDLSGNYIWAKTTQGGAAGTANGEKMVRHPKLNDIYITGRFTGTVDFDPGPGTVNATSNGGSDIFVMRMDTAGAVAWAKRMGGSGLDYGLAITADTLGAVYTTGRFGNLNADFDPGANTVLLPFSGGLGDVFVSKLDGNGNYAWARSMSSDGFEEGRGIAVDKNLNVYTTGPFQGVAEFNTGPGMISAAKTSLGGNDIFLHKFYQHICSTVYDTAYITACGSYYFNGQLYTSSGSYTEPYINTIGCDSLFTIDLILTEPFADTLVQAACASFVFQGETYTQPGTYTHVYTSVLNCDSTYTLQLTFNAVNTQVNRSGNTLTAGATGAAYQWINCNGDVPVPGATGSTFTPTQNGAYAVIITENNCTDTSYCYAITGITGLGSLDATTSLTVFPNPGKGLLTVTASRPLQHAALHIMDMPGRVLLSRQDINSNNINLDISSYAPGIYILELQEGGATAQFKLVKE